MLARRIAMLVIFAASPLAAQDSLPRASTFVLGAGVNLDAGRSPTPSLLLGREWRSAGSRFSLRLAGEYTAGSSSRLLFDYNDPRYAPYGTIHSRSQEVSISALTTFALSTGRIQPYLISGLMLQKQFFRSAITRDPTAQQPVGDPVADPREFVFRSSNLSLGAQVGVGLRARAGRGWVYTELRTHMPNSIAGDRAFPQSRSSPLTIGIQFE